MADTIFMMRQTFSEAAYSMLHLLPEKEQKETYGKFVYESGRAAFEIGYWLFDSGNASKVDEPKVTCPNHAHWIMAEPGRQEVAEYIGGWLTQLQAD